MNFHYHCHAVKFRDISIGPSLLFENSFSYLVVVELWRKSQLCSEIMGRGYVREGWSCSWSQANNCGTKKVLKLYKRSKPMKCKCFWFRKRKRGYSPSSQLCLPAMLIFVGALQWSWEDPSRHPVLVVTLLLICCLLPRRSSRYHALNGRSLE